MFEPRAHPGLRDRFRDRGRRQPRCVVLDAQPLTKDVRVERLEAGQTRQAAFEDRHFLVTIHPFDSEGRLCVELTDGACGRHAPS